MVNSLGKLGAFQFHDTVTPELAVAVEKLGYGTVWTGGSPDAGLSFVEPLLEATDHVVVATGIVNMWKDDAAPVAESYHRIVGKYPGRFLLGLGIGHPEATKEYQKPYDKMVEYLDQLDEAGVPVADRALAALGPKVLKLAGERTAGAHPYLTTPEHTRQARELLGETPLLLPEHKVVLETDPEKARAIGRPRVQRPYLHLSNYLNSWRRLGFTDEDFADGGSDRLVDAVVAWGTPEAIGARLTEHLDAGANHVAVQALGDDRLAVYRAVAQVLLS
ncbi:LLM class F420-dependent oxidoreductase [Amycolatopsis pithecellobii]|uniref:TIGR03620 family F420-dependent LLM class oxidoreductase n=1 Tax=Amycolatopsis pithecellobii TaxID=664692 RepID=A0A6N7YX87_9PSEU|nr:LLM class F420-dependent oxidoreductase [Amycolatopsis pithecellobii]MTD57685.1 TIGR03620 family F420-dependent LLM class oxidoreductase [Amycolatopsis pithecellobii]